MTADDLDTDGQSVLRERAGDGHGRISHSRDVVSGLHPRDVIFHFGAGNLRREMCVYVERKNLADGQNKEFIFVHEGVNALKEFGALGLEPGEVWASVLA